MCLEVNDNDDGVASKYFKSGILNDSINNSPKRWRDYMVKALRHTHTNIQKWKFPHRMEKLTLSHLTKFKSIDNDLDFWLDAAELRSHDTILNIFVFFFDFLFDSKKKTEIAYTMTKWLQLF